MHPIEHTIIPLLREEDKQSIELIMEYYGDTLYGIALKMVGDTSQAEDVMQESFMKIWKNASKYDAKKARLFTWLLNIVRNTAIDKIRKRKNDQENSQRHQSHVSSDPIAEHFRPECIDVKDKVESMEAKYKEVIEVLFFKGLTQREASDALNIPLGTVKTRLRIGLRQLRSVFIEHEFTIIILVVSLL